ncbi:MAG TPA: hypothetical protein VJ694_00045 [Patescibacteria group bacterium]|nr:hypothetical protein [Patescibacteria group bacterium]
MFPFLYPIVGLIAAFAIVMGAINFIARMNTRKALPEARPPELPKPEPAAPRVPTWSERMAAVGIPTACAYEGMGSYGLEVPSVGTDHAAWCPFADRGAKWLGKMFAVSVEELRMCEKTVPSSAYCDRCDDVMSMALFEIVKRPVPPGEVDQGWTEPRSLGRWCRRCGDCQPGRPDDSRVLGALWASHRNLYDLVEALESDDAKRELRKAKLACVETELDDVERRRERLVFERMRLQEELGMLKGPPNRDRFALPTAKLDDPPDDRAKAMPALVDDGTS